jgi:hypothetical protein
MDALKGKSIQFNGKSDLQKATYQGWQWWS